MSRFRHLASLVLLMGSACAGLPPPVPAAGGPAPELSRKLAQFVYIEEGTDLIFTVGVRAAALREGELFFPLEVSVTNKEKKTTWKVTRESFALFDAEGQRYEMPTQFLSRTAMRDVELRGQQIRAGQGVLLLYRSANRDEREFDEPDRFDIHRRPPRILSFGHGTHVCLGQHAARLEARVMYEELLAAVPEYVVVEQEVVRARSEFVDGYLRVPIVFGSPSGIVP